MVACLLHDRRRGYRVAGYLSAKLGAIRVCLCDWRGSKAEMNEKLATEEALQTPRGNVEVLESEKVNVDADMGGVVRDSLPAVQVVVR
jgi:hypothetical protein